MDRQELHVEVEHVIPEQRVVMPDGNVVHLGKTWLIGYTDGRVDEIRLKTGESNGRAKAVGLGERLN